MYCVYVLALLSVSVQSRSHSGSVLSSFYNITTPSALSVCVVGVRGISPRLPRLLAGVFSGDRYAAARAGHQDGRTEHWGITTSSPVSPPVPAK